MAVLREDGPRWLAWRLWYELQLRWGFRRSLPPVSDVGERLSQALRIQPGQLDAWLGEKWRQERGAFFVNADRVGSLQRFVGAPDEAVKRAERTLAGEFRYFNREWRGLGFPPDWLRGVRPDARWSSDQHWSRLPDLSPDLGDIKHVWEPSRFEFVYDFARAWAVTGDERYPEAFWKLTENWFEVNRPELGPHWRCAQEMSLRSMAWIFGLYAFGDSAAVTPERVGRLIKYLWYHASHIEKVHWYAAECVRNNHAVSEAVGLFTIGVLFPFLPDASRWSRKGVAALAKELDWQVYRDGAYVQHSMNYARFVVQLCTWVIRLAALNSVHLPATVRTSSHRLLSFMFALQDSVSGSMPNYGSNDGALILPLTSCDYRDYRPALEALSLALGEGRLYDNGPWDEEAAWLCGPESVQKEVAAPSYGQPQPSTGFPQGGYYTLQGTATHGFIRCASYRHRPAQADMLHLDVWYHGHNVLVDPGTYSYNAGPLWSAYFLGTGSHNTVTVDGRDQMRKGSRFMWHNWTRSRLVRFDESAGRVVFSGEHSAYAPVTHRRTVLVEQDTYLILDELFGDQTDHIYRLHWLLNDFSTVLRADGATVQVPGHGASPLRLAVLLGVGERVNWARSSESGQPRGWQSTHYGSRDPALSCELVRTSRDTAFVTILGPEERVGHWLEVGMKGLIGHIRAIKGNEPER